MTATIPVDAAYAVMLVFARVGATMMLLPAFGEQGIPSRARLALALVVTLILAPTVRDSFGKPPDTLWGLGFLFIGEIAVGLFIGLATRLVVGALQAAGALISMQLGLGFAEAVDPSGGGHGVVLGNFLTVLGIVLVFAADLHHLFLAGLHDSYALFKPAAGLAVGDFAVFAIQTTAQSFRLALQISAPFLAFGLLFYAGLGVLSRLMPQLQIFFLAMPASILLGFAVLVLVLGPAMTWFLGAVEISAARFLLR